MKIYEITFENSDGSRYSIKMTAMNTDHAIQKFYEVRPMADIILLEEIGSLNHE